MISNLKEIIVGIFDFFVTGEGQNVKNKKIISSIYYLLLFVGLFGAYQIANLRYRNFNCFQNEGIPLRLIKVFPLIVGSILICIYLIPPVIRSFPTLYWYLFIGVSMIPILVVYVLNGMADSKDVVVFLYALFFILFLGVFINNKWKIELPCFNTNETMFLVLVIGFTLGGFVYLFLQMGLPYNLFDAIKDVYGVRLKYRAVAVKHGYVDYIVQWLGNVTIPFLLAYTLKNKKYLKFAILPIALEVLLYSYTAYRSMFVVLVLAPFFGFVLSRGIKRTFLEKAFLFLVFFGTIAAIFNKNGVYVSTTFRIFIFPSIIALEYYDFFAMYPKVKLAHSALKRFNDYIYGNDEPAFYLASLYHGKPEMRLNTTWFADSYMNFGYGGLVVFAVALILLLLFIKSIEKKDPYLVAALLFGGTMGLFNAPLLTTMLTHGLGIGVFLACLLPENTEGKRSRNFMKYI